MAAPEGNNYKMKWKTQKERQDAFKAVCAHLEQGFNQDSFPDADWEILRPLS